MNNVNRIVSGGLLALFLTLIFQSLTFFGVISTGAGHLTVVLAWLVGAILIATEILPGRRTTHKALWILALGFVLAAIDVWAVHVKKGMDVQAKSEPQKDHSPQAPQPVAPPPSNDEGLSPKPIPSAKTPKKISRVIVTKPPESKPPAQSCPNGICIGGDNNGSAKVENYYGIYPPPNVTPTISICEKPSVVEGNIYKTTFVFKTDTEISNPAWWFLFDGPVIDVDVNANPKVIGFMHSHPPCDQIPMCDRSLGITLNNIGGLGSQLPWGPTTPLTAVVTSKQPVKLLEKYGRSMDKPLNENFVNNCE